MNILFVYSDINTMGFGGRNYHFGLGVLSAFLKKNGHKTQLFYLSNNNYSKNMLEEINLFKPSIIAITSDTTQINFIRDFLLRFKNNSIFTILGGPHASLYPECLSEIEGLNAICRGEGEYPLLELASRLDNNDDINHIPGVWIKKDNGEIIKNACGPFIENLDDLPFSDYELFDYQRVIDTDFGRVSFMLSRGCPFDCTYCSSPAMGKLQKGKYVRFMSPQRAIDELKQIKMRYVFKSIFFADDTFTLDRSFISEFCEKYKRDINIPFEANARVETITSDILDDLKEAGCFKIHMGIEHGNEDFRKNVLNRKMSNDRIIRAFKLVKEAGIACKSYNIVGFPLETEQLHADTVELNRTISPDGHVCYIFQPYPGTELYKICQENSFIDSEKNNLQICSRRDTILTMPNFPAQSVIYSQRNFSYKIYKNSSLRKALIYKVYYSKWGESLIRFFSPIKNYLRNFAMK